MSSDKIEKEVVLQAPIARVWRAISDSEAFGSWFGVKFSGDFAAGKRMVGECTPTTVDPEVAKGQEPYAGAKFEITVESLEPERLFSFRWHPFAVDENVDYSAEPTTLIEFKLEEVPGGTRLRIIESGFDEIPLERRATAPSR